MATKKQEVKVVEHESNEPYKPKRFLDLALENSKEFHADFHVKFNNVNKQIDYLLGLLNSEINHSDLSQLEFYLGQISNNIGKIALCSRDLSFIYTISENEIHRYIIDTDHDILTKPAKVLQKRLDIELAKLKMLKETLTDIDRLLPKRAEYIRTLISCEKAKIGLDYLGQSKQP